MLRVRAQGCGRSLQHLAVRAHVTLRGCRSV